MEHGLKWVQKDIVTTSKELKSPPSKVIKGCWPAVLWQSSTSCRFIPNHDAQHTGNGWFFLEGWSLTTGPLHYKIPHRARSEVCYFLLQQKNYTLGIDLEPKKAYLWNRLENIYIGFLSYASISELRLGSDEIHFATLSSLPSSKPRFIRKVTVLRPPIIQFCTALNLKLQVILALRFSLSLLDSKCICHTGQFNFFLVCQSNFIRRSSFN